MDLNSLSNEELMALAGPPSGGTSSAPDLNSLSNEELMQIAGAPAAKPLGAQETFAGGMSDILNKLTLGYGDELQAGASTLLGDAYTGVANMFGADRQPENYEANLAKVRDLTTRYQNENPISSAVNNAAGFLMPLPGAKAAVPVAGETVVKAAPSVFKTAGKGAALGSVFGGASGFGSAEGGLENRLESGAMGAGLGAAVGGGIPLVAKGVSGTASYIKDLFDSAGKKLELSAFGGTKAKIAAAMKRMPDVLDESGDFQNPIGKAIESFRKDGGGTAGMEGATLLSQLESQTKNYADDLGTALLKAQEKQKDAIIPEFKNTISYVKGLAGTDKAAATKIAQEEIANALNNTDGTILGLQSEKVKLGQSIADNAWGDDAAGRLKTNILKRVRSDLRGTIEQEYSKLTGESADVISGLNQKIGERQGLMPLFKDMIASDEARDPVRAALQTLRTSGGVGQTLIAGAAAGGLGGPVIGGAAVLGNLYLNTPTGKRQLSDALRSGLVKNTDEIAKIVSDASPAAAQRLAGILGQVTATKEAPSNGRLSAPAQPVQAAPEPQAQVSDLDQRYSEAINRALSSLTDGGKMEDTKAPVEDVQLDKAPAGTAADDLVQAVVLQESAGKKNAVSKAGAQGLMQLMPATGREWHKKLGLKGEYDPFDPEQNKTIGTAYLNYLLDMYDGDKELALTAYNQGFGRVNKLLARTKGKSLDDIIEFLGPDGQGYAKGVLSKLERIRKTGQVTA